MHKITSHILYCRIALHHIWRLYLHVFTLMTHGWLF